MSGECHAHIFMNGYNYKEAVRTHEGHINENEIRGWFREYQKRGVTFVRDGGDALGVSARAREIAPEYDIDYRTPVFAIHKNGHYGKIVGFGFNNGKEYLDLVRRVKREGGDFIKIMVSGILDFSCSGRMMCGEPLEKEEVRDMIRAAHEEGFAVMVHANGKKAVEAAAEAGADSIEHGNYIGREQLTAMKENGVIWVPTLATVRNLYGCGRYPEEEVEKIYEMAAENIRTAFSMGVQMAPGSDAGAYLVPHGQGIEDENRAFEEILGSSEAVHAVLAAGEESIRRRFQKN